MTEPSQYFKGRTVQEQMDEVIGYVDVRSAEVATAAIASDVAQVHQDMLDADADAAAAAASAAAAAGTLANAVKKTGEASQSIAGDIAVSGTLSGSVVTGTVITAPAPVNNTDAATKKYVDDADALKLNITDVNTYAVGLTGNQVTIAGSKGFNSLPGIGYRIRIAALLKIEIFRTPVVNGTNVIYLMAGTRSNGTTFGSISIEITAGAITSISKSLIGGTGTTACVYAYIEDNNLIIGVGNANAYNNYFTVVILGMFNGAGDSRIPDFTNIGSLITDSNPSSVVLSQ